MKISEGLGRLFLRWKYRGKYLLKTKFNPDHALELRNEDLINREPIPRINSFIPEALPTGLHSP